MRYDVIVVGNGVVGTSTAWHLARAGAKVALADRMAASGSSGLGAGSVTIQRWNRTDIALVKRTEELLAEMEQRTGGAFRFYRSGQLTLIGMQEHLPFVAEQRQILAEMGIRSETLDPEQAAARFPGLRVDDVLLAHLTPDDGYIRPPELTWAMTLLARLDGVDVLEGTMVQRLELSDGAVRGVRAGGGVLQADRVVVAAGPWSRKLMEASGLGLPIKPYRTTVSFVPVERQPLAPVLYDLITGLYTVPRNQGSLLIGYGTSDQEVDPNQFNRTPDPAAEQGALQMLAHRLPATAGAWSAGGWCGVCDMTPDGHPLLGPYPNVRGLYVACGFGGYGVMRGPGVGAAMAQWVLGEEPFCDLSAYRMDRYPGWFDFPLILGRPLKVFPGGKARSIGAG